MALITLLRTGCNQYTIKNGGTGTTYNITITNINNDLTHTWTIVDNADVPINFTIDGIYVFTTDHSNLFFNVSVAITSNMAFDQFTATQLAQYVAPLYIGTTITLVIPTYGTITYVIQSGDTTPTILAASLAEAINNAAISGLTAMGQSANLVISTSNPTDEVTETITQPFSTLLWSTCKLFKCINKLTQCILCAERGKCDEHTDKMTKERDELNRIMMLYGGLSFMDDNERWDYLNMSNNTDIFNDIFDKLNVITRRCGTCCEEHRKYKGEEGSLERFRWETGHDMDLEDNIPFEKDNDEGECKECGEKHHHHKCPEKVTEEITLVGTNVTPVS